MQEIRNVYPIVIVYLDNASYIYVGSCKDSSSKLKIDNISNFTLLVRFEMDGSSNHYTHTLFQMGYENDSDNI